MMEVAPALQLAAARHALGTLKSWEVVDLANQVATPTEITIAVASLSTLREPDFSEVRPLFLEWIAEAHVAMPTREEAIRTLLIHFIRQLAGGAAAPRSTLENLMNEVYFPGGLHALSKNYAGDSHGIERFIALYYEYDDIEERPGAVTLDGMSGGAALSTLDARALKLAREWRPPWGA